MPAPAHDLATLLAGTLSLPSPATGTVVLTYAAAGNLLTGPVRAADHLVDNLAVFVLGTGGGAPEPYLGDGPNENLWRARVQVTVRGALDAFEQGEGLARACLAELHLAEPSGYVSVRAQESVPNYLGQDERGCHLWTVNFVALWKA